MISYEDAQSLLLSQKSLPSHSTPIEKAAGLICASDVVSEVYVPSFLNSAMDGFAVQIDDLKNATPETPVKLKVRGSIAAGERCTTGKGGAWEIMTGACVPDGYDAVVRIEDVSILSTSDDNRPQTIELTKPINLHENIRAPGQDFKPSNLIIKKGSFITSKTIMCLAAIGQQDISVAQKPKVTVFSSGNELVTQSTQELLSGQIRDANGPYLVAALNECNIAANFGGVIRDDAEALLLAIADNLAQTDVFISTGAVSAGRYDFVPETLRELGAVVYFHKVAIRPGKPILYAQLPGGSHYFGLPGNPISAAIGLRFFVMPLLRQLRGMPNEVPLKARLSKPSGKLPALRFFAKAVLKAHSNGQLEVDILEGQESFKTHPLLTANCWAVFNEKQDEVPGGEMLDVYPIIPDRWAIAG